MKANRIFKNDTVNVRISDKNGVRWTRRDSGFTSVEQAIIRAAYATMGTRFTYHTDFLYEVENESRGTYGDYRFTAGGKLTLIH